MSVDTVRRYFCPDATEPEVMHFLAVCKYHKINPWLKEAYLIKYGQSDPATIVVGKDFYNRRAQDFPTYKGHAAGIILQVKDANGKLLIQRRPGAFHTDDEKLLGGWAKVYRSDREDAIEIEVEVGEYIQTRKDGSVTRFWKDKPATMIRKVALSQGWREAFPGEFQGTLDEAEVAGKEALTIEMPKSNTEAQATGSPAAPLTQPVKVEGKESPEAPTGDVSAPTEAKPEVPTATPTKTPRVLAGQLLRAHAQKTGESMTKTLRGLTGKNDVADLTEPEAQSVIAQLG